MNIFSRCIWAATAGVVALSACAVERKAPMSDVPAALLPPAKQALIVSTRGAGVQIYECQASKSDPTAFAWELTAPEAVLRRDSGQEFARHYAGPTWQANDGSSVVGEVVAHVAASDNAAIPWLLLRAKSHQGTGIMARVEFIQRLHTVGGKPPVSGCDAGYVGTKVRVDYSADYDFYTERP